MNDCPFCRLLASDDVAAKLPNLVLATTAALALVNRTPLAPGHLTLVFTAHLHHTSDLTDNHFAGVGGLIGRLSAALEHEFSPQRVVLLGDGKRSAHLHWHLIPEPRENPLDPAAVAADLNRPARPPTLAAAATDALVARIRSCLQ
jgi:histidine triad (HIT) family protein